MNCTESRMVGVSIIERVTHYVAEFLIHWEPASSGDSRNSLMHMIEPSDLGSISPLSF